MNTPPKIQFACPSSWEKMQDHGSAKHCAECGHMVHDFSSLTKEERAVLLERARTEKICASFYLRLSGELVTPDSPLSDRERRSIKQVGIAALSAGALALAAGCVSHPVERKPESSPQAEIRPMVEYPTPAPARAETKAKPEQNEEVIQLMGFTVSPPLESGAKVPVPEKKKEPNQTSEPTAPSGRGSS